MKTKQATAQSMHKGFRNQKASASSLAAIHHGDFEEAVSFVRKKAGFDARISVPRSILTDWREELESALILLQHATLDRDKGLDIPSLIDGAHALVDRVVDCLEDIEERTGERAPERNS